jgi:hypothetical protein
MYEKWGRSRHVLEVSSLGVQTQLNTALHIPEVGSQNLRRHRMDLSLDVLS